MNTKRASFFFRLSVAAVGVTLMLGIHRPAEAQYQFYPNNATINSSNPADIAIVGYANSEDWDNYCDFGWMSGDSPTVEVVAGADPFGLESYNSSIVGISGGYIAGSGVTAADTSKVYISGGTVSGAYAQDNAVINVEAGANIPGNVWAQSWGSYINVSGGTIGTSVNDAHAWAGGTLIISGGTFVSGQIFVDSGSSLYIFGGIGSRLVGWGWNKQGRRIPIYKSIFYIVNYTLVNSAAWLNSVGFVDEYQLSGQLGDGTNVNGVTVYAEYGATFTVSNP